MLDKIADTRGAFDAVARTLSDSQVEVTSRGAELRIYRDANGQVNRINLPQIPDSIDPNTLDNLRGVVDMAVGRVLFNDGAVEREAEAEGVASLFRVIEDERAEVGMKRRFAGSRRYFDKCFKNATQTLYPGLMVDLSPNPKVNFGKLITPILKAKAGDVEAVMWMQDKWPFVQKAVDLVDHLLSNVGEIPSSAEALERAIEISKLLKEEEPPEQEQQQESSDSEDPGEEGSEPDEDEAESDEGETDTEEEQVEGEAAPAAGDEEIEFESMVDAITDEVTTNLYEETAASEYLVFTREQDIIELLPQKEVTEWARFRTNQVERFVSDADRHVGVIRSRLERAIESMSFSSRIRCQRSGRLDSSNLHRLRMNDYRVFYQENEMPDLDVSVSLLVDCSGSMSGEPIELAMQAAYAISSALNRLRVDHEILGFTTKHELAEIRKERVAFEARLGRAASRQERLHIPIFKSFDEPLTSQHVKGMAYTVYGSSDTLQNNIDGEAVMVAAGRLLARPSRRRILMVMSDGNPQAMGEIHDQYMHLKNVVKRLADAKIQVVAVGIKSKAVKSFYRQSIVVDDLDELGGEMLSRLRNLLVEGKFL